MSWPRRHAAIKRLLTALRDTEQNPEWNCVDREYEIYIAYHDNEYFGLRLLRKKKALPLFSTTAPAQVLRIPRCARDVAVDRQWPDDFVDLLAPLAEKLVGWSDK